MISDDNMIKIIKYIDYIYVNTYIKNSLKDTNNLINSEIMNEWKIFSICSKDNNNKANIEKHNILYLIQNICKSDIFAIELLIWSIYIFKNICFKYAHLIDNYVYLFGTIYVISIKHIFGDFISYEFLIKTFDIDLTKSQKMVDCVNKCIGYRTIFLNPVEKKKIINSIVDSNY